MIDVNRLILNGTRFNYGIGIFESLHTLNNTKKNCCCMEISKKNCSALIENPNKKKRGQRELILQNNSVVLFHTVLGSEFIRSPVDL